MCTTKNIRMYLDASKTEDLQSVKERPKYRNKSSKTAYNDILTRACETHVYIRMDVCAPVEASTTEKDYNWDIDIMFLLYHFFKLKETYYMFDYTHI